MWQLLYIMLIVDPVLLSTSEGNVFLLETYATEDECAIERKRIGFDMAEAYPNDRDFLIVCRPAGVPL